MRRSASMCTREIYERDRYRCPSRPIGWRVFERVYFRDDEHRWRVMREYAEIKQRTQTNWNVLGRTRADFRRHSREHQSSISVYWPQDDEFAVTRMSTALTRSKLMLSQAYYEHFASSPIQCSPLTRRDQSSRKWKNKCPNGTWTSVLYKVP